MGPIDVPPPPPSASGGTAVTLGPITLTTNQVSGIIGGLTSAYGIQPLTMSRCRIQRI